MVLGGASSKVVSMAGLHVIIENVGGTAQGGNSHKEKDCQQRVLHTLRLLATIF